MKAKIHLIRPFARVNESDKTIEITSDLATNLSPLKKKRLLRAKKYGYVLQYVID
jgi:hypothetical protein